MFSGWVGVVSGIHFSDADISRARSDASGAMMCEIVGSASSVQIAHSEGERDQYGPRFSA